MNWNLCIFTLLFCGCNATVSAQTKKQLSKPSLYYLPSSIKDSIDVMNDLADTLCLHKDEKGQQLAATALQLSKQIKYHIGIGDASHSLGLIKFRRDNDSAIFYFKQAKSEYLKEVPGFEKMAFALNNLSRTYDELLQFDSSIQYALQALAFIQKNTATTIIKNKWLMYTYGAMANAFAGQTHYDSANTYYIKAVALAEQLRNIKMLEVYFKGLSGIQAQLGNYEKAAGYGRKAVDYIDNDCRALSIALANLGGIYSLLNDFANADKMADSSIKLGKRCNVWNSIGRNYSTLGNSKMQQKKYAAALQYFQIGLKEALLHHNSKSSISKLYRKMGEAYEALDSLSQAKENYLSALKTAEGDNEMMNALFLSLSQLSFKKGDAGSAYKYLKQYDNYRDTVYTNEKIKTITELNTRYETEKKDQQLLLLSKEKELEHALVNKQLQQIAKNKAEKREQEFEILNYQLETEKQDKVLQIQHLDIQNSRIKQQEQQMQLINTNSKLEIEKKEKKLTQEVVKNQRNWFMFLLLGIAVAGVILYLLFNRYRLIKQIKNLDELQQQRLHISRELHDELGATLSGIAMYSHLAKEQIKNIQTNAVENSLNVIQSNAGEMVNKLNDIIWLINPGQDSLQQLMQRLEDYAIQIAAVKNIRVKSNINGHHSANILTAETRRNIYLLFKEAINNAVKYSHATLLELNVKEDSAVIEIALMDDGDGFNIETVTRGNGLTNMQQRAKEIGGVLNIITSSKKGCIINLKLTRF